MFFTGRFPRARPELAELVPFLQVAALDSYLQRPQTAAHENLTRIRVEGKNRDNGIAG
jgi:hypothetical protein